MSQFWAIVILIAVGIVGLAVLLWALLELLDLMKWISSTKK